MSFMAYNFSVSLMKSSNTVVDPNHLLSSTDSAPAARSAVSVVSPVASVGVSIGASIGASVSIGGGGKPHAAAPSGAAGGFQECTGLDTTFEVEDYKEGGLNDRIRKFATRATWSNIVLKRGICLSDDLWTWYSSYVNGTGVRRDGIITLEDDQHNQLKQWHFTRGLPIKWSGPAYNAKTSEVAFEAIEIIHEGLSLTSPSTLASVAIGTPSISIDISL
jgi:phage tail-like protein